MFQKLSHCLLNHLHIPKRCEVVNNNWVFDGYCYPFFQHQWLVLTAPSSPLHQEVDVWDFASLRPSGKKISETESGFILVLFTYIPETWQLDRMQGNLSLRNRRPTPKPGSQRAILLSRNYSNQTPMQKGNFPDAHTAPSPKTTTSA